MILTKQDYRDILKDEFEHRVHLNSQYSMRAFARDLGVSPASLSEILKGRQGLSSKMAKQISSLIKMSDEEQCYFCDLVESQHGRSPLKRGFAQARLKKYQNEEFQQLQLDTIDAISNWYYFAILELTYVEGFKSDSHWVASQLGISRDQVEKAVQTLERLGLLSIEDGEWKDENTFLKTPSGIPSRAIKKMHSHMLMKSQLAIEKQSVDERDASAIVMAFNDEDMQDAKNMIKDFRRKFLDRFSKNKKKNKVYSLNIHFFNLLNRGTK